MDNLQLIEKEIQLFAVILKSLSDIDHNGVIPLHSFEKEMEEYINEFDL